MVRAPGGPTGDLETLFILGAGGHGREMAWLAEQVWGDRTRIRFLVTDEAFAHGPVNGIDVDVLDEEVLTEGSAYLVAIGDPAARRSVAERIAGCAASAATLVHPGTRVAPTVTIGAGSALWGGTTLTTNIALGAHVHVNVGASVSHDVTVGDFTSISPGARVCGHVVIGAGVHVGAGATVINGRPDEPLVIGDGAVVGAGACVVGPVAPGELVVGVPARPAGRRATQ